jgi:predicted DsbA family dithiol-disulfide isomerase
MKRLEFSYYSDPLCIWAFVAQPKLEQILSEWGDRMEVDYRIVPVFGSVPERFDHGAWAKAGPEGRRDATRRVAKRQGRDDVSGEIWVTDPPASSLASGAAVKAVFALESQERAEPGSGARYLLAMREHFFVGNRNIARRREQLAVAESLGIEVAALEEKLEDGTCLAALFEDDAAGKSLGVRGSPTYVFDGGRAMLYGNFPFAILHATAEELLSGLGVDASAC